MNRPALAMTTDMGANDRVEGRDAASSLASAGMTGCASNGTTEKEE